MGNTTETIVDRVRREFVQAFGDGPRLFRAPGRVNLIGEHTDYNDGFVLPAAIDRETIVAARVRDDRMVNAVALDKGESVGVDLDADPIQRRGNWVDYVEGTIRSLHAEYGIARGADLVFASTVPIGSGLSSSAAIEVSIGLSIVALNEINHDPQKLAFAAQKAEHEYVGTKSGIMDQFASIFSREGHALLLDCRDLSRTYVPLILDGASLVICDSGVHHELASSEYNQRRAECDQAVAILANHLDGVKSLRDVQLEDLDAYGHFLSPKLLQRARHVVSENGRTQRAAEALDRGELTSFGELMFASHASLRDDYEVSCRELDKLVEVAGSTVGVSGSRMTGGGFGGCTVSIVADREFENFRDRTVNDYCDAFGFEPAVFQVRASEGACEL